MQASGTSIYLQANYIQRIYRETNKGKYGKAMSAKGPRMAEEIAGQSRLGQVQEVQVRQEEVHRYSVEARYINEGTK